MPARVRLEASDAAFFRVGGGERGGRGGGGAELVDDARVGALDHEEMVPGRVGDRARVEAAVAAARRPGGRALGETREPHQGAGVVGGRHTRGGVDHGLRAGAVVREREAADMALEQRGEAAAARRQRRVRICAREVAACGARGRQRAGLPREVGVAAAGRDRGEAERALGRRRGAVRAEETGEVGDQAREIGLELALGRARRGEIAGGRQRRGAGHLGQRRLPLACHQQEQRRGERDEGCGERREHAFERHRFSF